MSVVISLCFLFLIAWFAHSIGAISFEPFVFIKQIWKQHKKKKQKQITMEELLIQHEANLLSDYYDIMARAKAKSKSVKKPPVEVIRHIDI